MLEIILVQGFCPLKIKITQFPNGFYLNFFFSCIACFLNMRKNMKRASYYILLHVTLLLYLIDLTHSFV